MYIFAETKPVKMTFLLDTGAETKESQTKVQIFTNPSNSSSTLQQSYEVGEENRKSDVIENTSNQPNCRTKRTVGYR